MSDDMASAILKLRQDIDKAQSTADSAVASINSHERICVLRYETINAKLDIIPDVFKKMDSMSSRLNIAYGVWVGVLGIGGFLGIIYTLTKLAHGV